MEQTAWNLQFEFWIEYKQTTDRGLRCWGNELKLKSETAKNSEEKVSIVCGKIETKRQHRTPALAEESILGW